MKLTETFNSLIGNDKYSEITKLVKDNFPNFYNEELLEDIFNWIEKSGVKSIKFEALKKATGMAHYNKLILDKKILIRNNFCFFLYVLLHETSHYYQFKKHGDDIEYDVFNNDDTKEIINNLLNIEIAADRLAIMKLRQLKNKFNIKCSIPQSIYKILKNNGATDPNFVEYIENVRDAIKNKKINNNTELVDYVYNLVS